jgi:nitrite reductase (NADH) small subunit/3-phenylpropionate/trans-cinnamate dioxygenase ferredoxin subunit
MAKVHNNWRKPRREEKKITVGRVEAIPNGRGATVQLKGGGEIALFNVNGKFYATENFCPHKGAPLADSRLYGNVVECDLHGWRFDVTSGECFTKKSCSIETYEVVIEDGWIKILV